MQKQCKWLEPDFLAEKLTEIWGIDGLIWLDGDGSKLGKKAILGVDPVQQICCHGVPSDINAKNPFNELRKLGSGHWTGWLSYEAGAWIEPKNSWKPSNMSILWVAKHDPVFKLDLQRKELWIEGNDKERFKIFLNFIEQLNQVDNSKKAKRQITIKKEYKGIDINSWTWSTDIEIYAQQVEKIKDLIKKGDIFQANLSTHCIANLPKEYSILELYKKLRKACPAPFSGLVVANGEAQGQAILSSSPERFLRKSNSGKVETRPIKGTRPRHKEVIKDLDNAADLICSSKDRAENIMIVDILRNDLGKVCTPGSINVTQLVGLESYQQVHHLTSVVEGLLDNNQTWVDLIEACWPGGSISGAPKIRACQRLNELEIGSRGPYCGSLIHMDWDGTLDSNLLIRTVILNGKTIKVHGGCGIVADSIPSNEAEELKWKLLPILKALE